MARLLTVGCLLFLVVALLVGFLLFRGCGSGGGMLGNPPAPDAPEAPQWCTGTADASNNQEPRKNQKPPAQPERLAVEPVEEPLYQWPDDFELPLEIVIGDLPEVPEKVMGPSPPIDQNDG